MVWDDGLAGPCMALVHGMGVCVTGGTLQRQPTIDSQPDREVGGGSWRWGGVGSCTGVVQYRCCAVMHAAWVTG